ncbi:hypothetical protein QJS66_21080 [Kocuria rhizophila]|nr:hypothetical protein QJS66_21080 [Kocuria rhizophila]
MARRSGPRWAGGHPRREGRGDPRACAAHSPAEHARDRRGLRDSPGGGARAWPPRRMPRRISSRATCCGTRTPGCGSWTARTFRPRRWPADPRVRTESRRPGVLERRARGTPTLRYAGPAPARVVRARRERGAGASTARSARRPPRGASPRRMPRDHAGCGAPADTDRRLEDRVGHHG